MTSTHTQKLLNAYSGTLGHSFKKTTSLEAHQDSIRDSRCVLRPVQDDGRKALLELLKILEKKTLLK